MRLPLVNVSNCPDRGLKALYELNDPKFDIYAWLVVMVALEQLFTLSTIGIRSYKNFTFKIKDTLTNCSVPTGLVFIWSLFTSASVALVGITMRGTISVFTKTIHVVAESLFLVTLFASLNLSGLCGLIIAATTFMILWVMSIPDCLDSVTIAVSLGVTLDFINFFTYLLLGCTQHENKNLWSFIHGLGWHVLYLSLFVAIHLWEAPKWFFADLRLMGGTFNILAVEIFILLLKRIHIDPDLPSGWMKLSVWKSYPRSSIAWDGDKVLSLNNDNMASHNPQESAYAKGSLLKFWMGYRNISVKKGNKIVQYSFIYPVKEYTLSNDVDQDVYVYDLSHVRLIRIIIVFGLSVLLWYI